MPDFAGSLAFRQSIRKTARAASGTRLIIRRAHRALHMLRDSGYPWLGMLGRLAALAAVLGFAIAPSAALAAPQDVASTHAYIVASYNLLHTAVTTWSKVEAGIRQLDAKFHAECPDAGTGSPQNEEGQALSTEAAGALWASGYQTDARIVRAYVKAIGRLKWSNPAITRSDRRLAKSLREMLALQIPPLCADIHAWSATGFKSVPADAKQYAQHVAAIEINEIPRRLLAPYVQPSDRSLRARAEHLATRYEELEFQRGQADWDALLETLALNQ